MSRPGHRKPPRPAAMQEPRRGHCKFCGDPIMVAGKINKRMQWHSACALKWTIMSSPRDARRFVFVRDRGVCCDCGTNCAPGDAAHVAELVERIMNPAAGHMRFDGTDQLGDWELDHNVPLYVAARLGSPPELWQLGNMRTRCAPCHVIKTRADRARYGASHDTASASQEEALRASSRAAGGSPAGA